MSPLYTTKNIRLTYPKSSRQSSRLPHASSGHALSFVSRRHISTPTGPPEPPQPQTQDQSKPSPQLVEFTKSSKVAPWFSTHPVKTPFTFWQVTRPFTSTSPGGGVTTCGSVKQGAGGGGAAVAVTGPEHPSSHDPDKPQRQTLRSAFPHPRSTRRKPAAECRFWPGIPFLRWPLRCPVSSSASLPACLRAGRDSASKPASVPRFGFSWLIAASRFPATSTSPFGSFHQAQAEAHSMMLFRFQLADSAVLDFRELQKDR